MTQGDETAAKAILNPGDLGGGTEKVVLGGRGEVSFFSGRKSLGTLGAAYTPRRGGGFGAGAAPGVWLWSGWEQMAPDPRVPAAAAAPRERPASVRRGGWTRRAEGASYPPTHPPPAPRPVGLWLLSAKEWSPSPHLFQRVLVGRIWEREA